MKKNRRVSEVQRARRIRMIVTGASVAALYLLFFAAYVVPRDEMIRCGLQPGSAESRLACQDRVFAVWPLGRYLSGGVSPSESARQLGR